MMSKILRHVDEQVKKFNYEISERERDELITLYEMNHDAYDELSLSLHVERFMQRIARSDRTDWGGARRHSVVAKRVDAAGYELPTFRKTAGEREFLEAQLGAEIPFSFLSPAQKSRLVASMYPLVVEQGVVLIRQGELGSEMYVVEQGEFEVLVDGVFAKRVLPGAKFGELALLHEIPRTATVRATQRSKVWAAEQTSFSCIRIRDQVHKRQLVREVLARSPGLSGAGPAALEQAVAACSFKVFLDNVRVELRADELLIVFRDTTVLREAETAVRARDVLRGSFTTTAVLECGVVSLKSAWM
ncbi:cAMP-dependent protein kinase regulator [Pancytospora philotis]|nr:cAMP-dependent protein kinase regulator [Pancytospora philotis]